MNAPTPPLAIAKVFTTGRSQAVRLPKAYRFDTAEVFVERQGDAVVLRPKPNNKRAWQEKMRAVVNRFQGMPVEIKRGRGKLTAPVKIG